VPDLRAAIAIWVTVYGGRGDGGKDPPEHRRPKRARLLAHLLAGTEHEAVR
jgi:hypothetical protein